MGNYPEGLKEEEGNSQVPVDGHHREDNTTSQEEAVEEESKGHGPQVEEEKEQRSEGVEQWEKRKKERDQECEGREGNCGDKTTRNRRPPWEVERRWQMRRRRVAPKRRPAEVDDDRLWGLGW